MDYICSFLLQSNPLHTDADMLMFEEAMACAELRAATVSVLVA